MARRRRYNRGNYGDTMRVAQLTAHDHSRNIYVYPTVYGYAMEYSPPPCGTPYYLIVPDGTIHDKRDHDPRCALCDREPATTDQYCDDCRLYLRGMHAL